MTLSRLVRRPRHRPAARRLLRPRRRAGRVLPVRAGGRHRRLLARPHAPQRGRAPERPHRLRDRAHDRAPAGHRASGAVAQLRRHAGRAGRRDGRHDGPAHGEAGRWSGCRTRCRSSRCGGTTPSSSRRGGARYLAYDSPENLVAVGLAVASAEQFWELPVIGRFLPAPHARHDRRERRRSPPTTSPSSASPCATRWPTSSASPRRPAARGCGSPPTRSRRCARSRASPTCRRW